MNIVEKFNQINFEELFQKLGYVFFKNGNYNLNIFGIRNLEEGNQQKDVFNDYLCCIYKENGKWIKKIWKATTDPSLYYLKNLCNSKGCAIVVPGQYRGSYKIDYHNGKYKALCQRKTISVYRDNNKDEILDFNASKINKGIFGINIHHSGNNIGESKKIGKYSAGCQVFKNINNFYEFMGLCYKAEKLYGNSFTYTLLTSDQLK